MLKEIPSHLLLFYYKYTIFVTPTSLLFIQNEKLTKLKIVFPFKVVAKHGKIIINNNSCFTLLLVRIDLATVI